MASCAPLKHTRDDFPVLDINIFDIYVIVQVCITAVGHVMRHLCSFFDN